MSTGAILVWHIVIKEIKNQAHLIICSSFPPRSCYQGSMLILAHPSSHHTQHSARTLSLRHAFMLLQRAFLSVCVFLLFYLSFVVSLTHPQSLRICPFPSQSTSLSLFLSIHCGPSCTLLSLSLYISITDTLHAGHSLSVSSLISLYQG